MSSYIKGTLRQLFLHRALFLVQLCLQQWAQPAGEKVNRRGESHRRESDEAVLQPCAAPHPTLLAAVDPNCEKGWAEGWVQRKGKVEGF